MSRREHDSPKAPKEFRVVAFTLGVNSKIAGGLKLSLVDGLRFELLTVFSSRGRAILTITRADARV